MGFQNIKLSREDSIASIRLNQPDALNALSPELLEEFSRAVAEVGQDQGVKALVVRGEGRAFCAGADLMFFDATFEDIGNLASYVRLLNRCFLQLEELPIPTIALVHGFALAAGLELTLACDMVIAAEDARIFPAYSNPNRSVASNPDAARGLKHRARAQEGGWEFLFGYKLHLLTDAAYDVPRAFRVAPAKVNDSQTRP